MACRGECLSQCSCTCSDCTLCKLPSEECKCQCANTEPSDQNECTCFQYIMRNQCTCGHREHYGCCKPKVPCSDGCEPKLCPNDKNHDVSDSHLGSIKGTLFPQWYLDAHGGNCVNCAMTYGYGFKHTDKVDECPICYETKSMIMLRCNHMLCWECWSSICGSKPNDDPEVRASCPLCRRKKW